jgi:hypothetical protein
MFYLFSLRSWRVGGSDCLSGGCLPCSCHAMPKATTRQFTPIFPPRWYHIGDASPVSCHFLWHKILNPAALPLLVADTNGGNVLNGVNCNENCNL